MAVAAVTVMVAVPAGPSAGVTVSHEGASASRHGWSACSSNDAVLPACADTSRLPRATYTRLAASSSLKLMVGPQGPIWSMAKLALSPLL